MEQNLLSRIGGRLAREWSDVGLLGSSFVTHHAARLAKRDHCEIRLRGVGKVQVRPRDSDLASLRQAFQGREYLAPRPIDDAMGARYEAILDAEMVPVIIDAGANIGAASLWFRHKYPAAHIVAIEPDPANFAVLKENLGRDRNVTLIEAAIGAQPGNVQLVVEGDSWATQTTRSDSGAPIVTMADAFAATGGGAPFIAKIDIEGFESDLFSDNLGWLDRVMATFIEPHDWRFPGKHTSRSFQRATAARDFHLFMVGENLLYVRL